MRCCLITRRVQLQVKKLSDATATKVQESIDSHQKSMGALEAVWSANHDTVLIELNASKGTEPARLLSPYPNMSH